MYNKKIDGWVEGRIPNRWMDGRLYKLIYEIIYWWLDEYKKKKKLDEWLDRETKKILMVGGWLVDI